MGATTVRNASSHVPFAASSLEKEWESLYSCAKKNDYHNLAYSLIGAAIGSTHQNHVRMITKDWMDRLRIRRFSDTSLEEFALRLEKVRPHLRFMLSLTTNRVEFITKLFSNETTLYILSSENANDIRVITSDPSTENIYEYSKAYTDVLASGRDSFEFMVNGESEVDDMHYNVRIAKDEWHALSR